VDARDRRAAEVADPDVAERAPDDEESAPTVIVSTTFSVAGSMREIVPSATFGIHSSPSGPRTPSEGPLPTVTVDTTLFVAGSMRVTLPDVSSETQTPSACGSTQSSLPCPTGTVVTAFVAGSILKMFGLACEPIQIAPAPARMQVGDPSKPIVFTTLFFLGSIRDTVSSSTAAKSATMSVLLQRYTTSSH